MLHLDKELSEAVCEVIRENWDGNYNIEIPIQQTRKEFSGDRTVVVFPFLKLSGMSPEQTGEVIGKALTEKLAIVVGYNCLKGFLNIDIRDSFWLEWLNANEDIFKDVIPNKEFYMVEFSSPNTNKPLHLGHIRNCLLGYSVSQLLEKLGNRVLKAQIINDRGIHICKSMLAWKKYGNGETPDTSGVKGDHLVGKYYVKFDRKFKEEVKELMGQGMSEEEAGKNSQLMQEAQQMLRDWENREEDVLELWKTMNGWVYDGFENTYHNLGVSFDKLYYESETYLEGKRHVLNGLENGVFEKDDDGSVWADLSNEGLDRKILIRSDGTTVYMTQDVGTAIMRFVENPELQHLIYTVGNEQDYHFRVLFHILNKLGYEWASGCVHLSYGMVELPEGKMKSREGTVVDADDLIEEMFNTAREKAEELGKLEGLGLEEKEKLYKMIGLGALKYFILKVDPKKQMVFNPGESIDFNGNTGPFIQYTHARIKTLLNKSGSTDYSFTAEVEIEPVEKQIIRQLYLFREVLREAAGQLNPAIIANYIYDLVKLYNQFYQAVTVLKEEDEEKRNFRLYLSGRVALYIREGMGILGIEVPEQM